MNYEVFMIEKEVKVLNINKQALLEKLNQLGIEVNQTSIQKIYTYDMPTLYHRFLEIKCLLAQDNVLLVKTNLARLGCLLEELFDFLSQEEEQIFFDIFGIKKWEDFATISGETLQKIAISNKQLEQLFEKHLINENKWVRLRQTNNKTTIAVKHIIQKKKVDFQYVSEQEIEVPNLQKANELLAALGFFFRNYQEKRRTSFCYKNLSLELDEWPLLKPYLEIEYKNEDELKELIKLLELENHPIVSTNTQDLYNQIGIDVLNISELKFAEE
jgi:adenylate cyclase class 2